MINLFRRRQWNDRDRRHFCGVVHSGLRPGAGQRPRARLEGRHQAGCRPEGWRAGRGHGQVSLDLSGRASQWRLALARLAYDQRLGRGGGRGPFRQRDCRYRGGPGQPRLCRDGQKDFDRAIGDYDEMIRLDPSNSKVHMNRGIACQAKGDFRQAIADYDAAILLGFKTAQAYNNRGHAREMKQDYDKAIADYTEAIQLKRGYYFVITGGTPGRPRGRSTRRSPTMRRRSVSIPSPPGDMPSRRRSLGMPPAQTPGCQEGGRAGEQGDRARRGRGTPPVRDPGRRP